MPTHSTPPARRSGQEEQDYQQAASDHDELMTQLADREAQIENGLIDSYSDYSFTWTYPDATGE